MAALISIRMQGMGWLNTKAFALSRVFDRGARSFIWSEKQPLGLSKLVDNKERLSEPIKLQL